MISSSTWVIFGRAYNAAAYPSLASTPRSANWSATLRTPVRVGTFLPVWSTSTTSAPTPPASPSLMASTIYPPIEDRSQQVSRMTLLPLLLAPSHGGGSKRDRSAIHVPDNS